MVNLFGDVSFGIEGIEEQTKPAFDKVSVTSLLSQLKSGLSLDISKSSTGVALWENGELKKYRISLDLEYSKEDPYSEARMRLEFKGYLTELLGGREFEVAVVENVFGGENFDTVRKLLALNTVLDELALTGVIKVGKMFKWGNQEWKSWLRKLHKVGHAPTDKYEIEQVMLALEFDFALEHCNARPSVKEEIGYQDILDATGQLCALSLMLNSDTKKAKPRSIGMKSVEVTYIADLVELDYIEDSIFGKFPIQDVILTSTIEKTILSTITADEDYIYAMEVNRGRLGTFGIKHNIPFGDGTCVLLFFRKDLRKKAKEIVS